MFKVGDRVHRVSGLKPLPPDKSVQALADKINAQLPAGTGVSFYLIEAPDGNRETGIVFECGDRRRAIRVQRHLGDGDVGSLVAAIKKWVAGVQQQSRWTTDPGEAA